MQTYRMGYMANLANLSTWHSLHRPSSLWDRRQPPNFVAIGQVYEGTSLVCLKGKAIVNTSPSGW